MVNRIALLTMLLAVASCDEPTLPRIEHPVNDVANVLSAGDRENLSRQLVAHRTATGVQIAVLTVRSTNGMPIEDFSHRIATTWGGGQRGVDNGVLITLAIRDHCSRIEVGSGLEANLPDGLTRLMLDAARPSLRHSDYYGALNGIVAAIVTRTNGMHLTDNAPIAGAAMPTATEMPVPPTPPAAPTSGLGDSGTILLVGLLALLSGVFIIRWMMSVGAAKLRAEEESDVARERELQEEARKWAARSAAEAKAKKDADTAAEAKVGMTVEKVVQAADAGQKIAASVAQARAAATAPVVTYKTPQQKAPSVKRPAYDYGAAYRADSERADSDRADRERADRERREEDQRAEDRRRREREDDDRRRRDEDSRRSSSSYSSSNSSSSSSDSGSSWSGGGGDFGGGGSSGDW